MSRPITFSKWSIGKIIAGEKTMTRRVIARQPPAGMEWAGDGLFAHPREAFGVPRNCPFAPVGGLLWVREPFALSPAFDDLPPSIVVTSFERSHYEVRYTATDTSPSGGWGRVRSSRFMPEAMSRISLKVTGLTAERLQAITPEDVASEGVKVPTHEGKPLIKLTGQHAPISYLPSAGLDGLRGSDIVRAYFAETWDDLHRKQEQQWAADPWVWVVTFEVEQVRDGGK